jgi:biotin-dependent carboxylase-like uncharacterized protein
VHSPGLLTTVQDLGRFGYSHLGISASGAADALALRAGNLLVGNAENAAALEMTLTGGVFEFDADTTVALTGGDFDGGIPMWTAISVRAGQTLRCGSARGGARGYLCVHGGIDVPMVLGSASTHLFTGLGGCEGRALRRGDELKIGSAAIRQPRTAAVPRPAEGARGVLRVTSGPQAEWFGDDLYQSVYQVAEDSNRMGLRLTGSTLSPHTGQMITAGVTLGAVQSPPGGQPIILFVDHQTTGGYPIVANVISADLWRVGQLRPRDSVSFEPVTLDEAIELLRTQEEWLHGLV